MADIPINPVTRRVEFTGNTGTGPFAFTFNVLAQADIAVYKNNGLLTLTSHYTVSLNSNGTGSITLASALIATDELVIIGDLPLSRTTDFVTAGDLLASSLNEQFDSNVVMSQQLDERFDRTIRSQPGDINKNLYLPLVDDRVSQLLSFDSSGNITTTSLSNVPDIGTVNLTVSGLASFADGSLGAPSITNIGDTNTGIYFPAADQLAFTAGGNNIFSITSTYGLMSKPLYFSDGILLTDNSATALTIKEGSNNYLTFVTTNGSEKLSFGKPIDVTGAITTNTSLNIASSTTVDGILDEDNMASNSATKLATQQSIKAYVDAQVGTVDTLAEVLGNGNTTGSNNIIVTAGQSITVDTISETTAANGVVIDGVTLKDGGATVTADVSFGDNDKAIFGAGSDLEIYHSGTASHIKETGTGNLKIEGTNIEINNGAGTKTYILATDGGAVQLRYDDSPKIATTSTGVSISGNAAFGDTNKATFGDGSDLEIFHWSNNASYIQEKNPTGSLFIEGADIYIRSYSEGDNMIVAQRDGAVTLYYDNAAKIATTSTGVDITGTLTSDGLTVESTGGAAALFKGYTSVTGVNSVNNGEVLLGNNASFQGKISYEGQTSGVLYIENSYNNDAADILFRSKSSGTAQNKLLIDGNGDISFYEDTGSTAKLQWSASNERLGLTGSDYQFYIQQGSNQPWYNRAASDGSYRLHLNGTGDIVTLDSSGSVGIGGTPVPSTSGYDTATLHLRQVGSSSVGSQLKFTNGVSGHTAADGGHISYWFDNNFYLYNAEAGDFRFFTSATERMRLTSAGDLLVSKTSVDSGVVGVEAKANGTLVATVDGDTVSILNRKTSNGEILRLQKDGSTVGSISTYFGNPMFGKASGSRLAFDTSVIYSTNDAGTTEDGSYDLGTSGSRFDDIFAVNGTIQTSDRNEKQDIAELTDAEQRVAVAAKGLLRKFRWKDAVAEKGNEARTHFGIIAQDLQAAFAAEGLNAGDYAMFISSTWTDEDTGEERTRMGVRYSELLAFIIAAI